MKNVHSDVTALDHKLTDVKATDIGSLRSDFTAAKLELLKQLMPVGSIIAWVGHTIGKGDLPGVITCLSHYKFNRIVIMFVIFWNLVKICLILKRV